MNGGFPEHGTLRLIIVKSTLILLLLPIPVFIWGTDIIQPVLNLPFLSLALFGDVAFQGANHGEMIGFGGRIISILPYVFQVRFLGENFIPSYFDSTYDIYRGTKFAILNSDTTVIEPSVAWMATTVFRYSMIC